ncbi:MAG: M20/M25/M40 family metallo-hydrolase [Thermoplasmata archaeon]|nr:MAG: M20/M25/M40 family metallo-hydrolase [Thermoplasmata archaeon]
MVFAFTIFILISPLASASVSENENAIVHYDDSEFSWSDGKPPIDELILWNNVRSSRMGSRALTAPPVPIQQAIGNILETVSEDNLNTFLNKLVGFGSRLYRAPGMYNASIWLHDALEGNGRLLVEYNNFTTTTTWGTFTLSNVILTLPGLNSSSDKIYYMYAHSDAVQLTNSSQWLTNTPGADDDGSGCAAVLEAARVLSRYDFHDTIKFAFFNAEEIGLRGSNRYTQKIAAENENVQGGIDYDMIGHSTGNPQYGLDLISNPASANLAQYMIDVNERYDIGLTITAYQRTGSLRSDIDSFYARGFPSVMGIETEFSPYYHSLSDTVDKLNLSFMGKNTNLAVATLAEWARLIYTDLSITGNNLTVSNLFPNEAEDVEITVNVTNTGNLNADNMEVVFYDNGMQFASTRIRVEANNTNITTTTWQPTVGSHNISVVVDPKNEIVETDETNNSASIILDVNDVPKAILTANPMKTLTSEQITFNGSLSLDYVGGITEYNFTFGDGNNTGWLANSTASHAYEEDGVYTAGLTVRDIYGAESKLENLSVNVLNRAPVASPSSNLSRTLTYTSIQFMANATDPDGTVSTSWDFGDSMKSNEADPIHYYSKSGNYNAVLNIYDNDGANASYKLKIIIDNRPPICTINASEDNGIINTVFLFKAEAEDLDGTIESYQWDLGDGTTSNGLFINHIYSSPGVYYIRLRVEDNEGFDSTATRIITVQDLPPVAVGEALLHEVLTYEKVPFVGDKSYDLEGELIYIWEFGDGNTSTEVSPIHAYWQPGNYTAKLTVWDNAGNFDSVVTSPITVNNRPPTAEFWTFGNYTENGTVYFDGGNSSDLEGDLTYYWEFDDGSVGSGPMVEHIYSEPGKYLVYLTVTDKHNSSDTYSLFVTITPRPVEKIDEDDNKIIVKEESQKSNSNLLLIILVLIIVIILISILALMLYLKRPKTEDKDQKAIPTTTQEPLIQGVPYPTEVLAQPQSQPDQVLPMTPVVPALPQLPSNLPPPEPHQPPVDSIGSDQAVLQAPQVAENTAYLVEAQVYPTAQRATIQEQQAVGINSTPVQKHPTNSVDLENAK